MMRATIIHEPALIPRHTIKKFLGFFRYTKLVYELAEPFTFDVHHGELTRRIVIPKGFRCDLASIPRFLWWKHPPDGPYRAAAMGHDPLYESEALNRELNDLIFRALMEAKQVDEVVEAEFFRAVRWFGWVVYLKHKKARTLEVRRQLIEVNPHVTNVWLFGANYKKDLK